VNYSLRTVKQELSDFYISIRVWASVLACIAISAVCSPAQVVLPQNGVIGTLAGNGTSGYSGDNGLATSAELTYPGGVAVDGSGNIYIADTGNCVVRLVSASTGVITTVAGNGSTGYSGDNGAATSAHLNSPAGVALDGTGNLYIVDSGNSVIRMVSASTGVITTVAGNGIQGYSGDGGLATAAELNQPAAIAIGPDSSMYIVDSFNAAVRKVAASSGIITTIAGNGTWGYSGDNGAATDASLFYPDAIALDLSNNLYIADYFDHTIRKVTTATGIITTVAGNGTDGYSGDGGQATNAQLDYPQGVAVDSLGNIYIAHSEAGYIREVIASSGIITTIAGNGNATYSGDGGPAPQAGLFYPALIAVTSAPTSVFNVYVADLGNNAIRAFSSFKTAAPIFSPISATYSGPQTVTISDYFSSGTIHYTTDGTTPTSSSTVYSGPIAVSASETLKAIAITADGFPTAVATAPYTITQTAPTVDFSAGFITSGLNLVQSSIVSGALQLSDGNLSEQRAAWYTTPVSSHAFTSDFNYQALTAQADGITLTLQNDPSGINAIGLDGQDLGYAGIQSSVAIKFDMWNNLGEGIDSTGYYTNGAEPILPALDLTPYAVILRSGNLLHVHVTYDGTTLTWTISDTTTNASFTDSTVIDIPTIVGGDTAYVGITGSTGGWTSTQYVSAWTHISGPATTYAAQPAFSLASGTYNAPQSVTISDSTTGAVIYYTVDGSTPGTLSNVYSGAITVAATETLNAIAVASGYYNSSDSAATYTISSGVTVSVSPLNATLYGGQTQQFSATVSNSGNTAVTWSISPSGIGAINSSGLYTAPTSITTQQTVTITATSQADTTKTGSATITLSSGSMCSGFGFVRAIVIEHSQIPNTDQANFPFLFNTTDPTFASVANGGHVANANGYDIVFSSDPAGLNRLNFELEKYDPVAGQIISWIGLPTLSHTSDTVLYIFYGNSSITASQQNPAGVWDSHYMGVWHVPNGTQLSLVDSTAYGNNASNNGAVAAAGEIDGGMQTNGTTYATIGAPANLANLAQGNATFSAWVNPSTQGGMILGKAGFSEGGWTLGLDQANNLLLEVYGTDNLAISSPVASGWNYVVGTITSPGGPVVQSSVYVNGALVDSETGLNYSPIDDSTAPAYLANNDVGDFNDVVNSPLNGVEDEFRISNIVRSPDWIATEFNNQSSPSRFYTLYPENNQGVLPNQASLYASQSEQFTVASGCTTEAATWSLSTGAPGSLTAGGAYTAPASIASVQSVTVTAVSLADGSTIGSAAVSLLPPPVVTISPANPTLYGANATLQFTATVGNATNTAVTWATSPSNAGSISPSGLYTAGYFDSQQTATITATSQVDPAASASTTLTLAPLNVAPQSTYVYGGFSQQFSATFPVTWSISPAGAGSINSLGIYSAPANITTPEVVTIIATSQADPAVFSFASIIAQPPATLNPLSATLISGQSQQFSICMATSGQSQSCDPSVASWTVNPTGAGTVSATGLFSAPTVVSSPATEVVTATDLSNPAISTSSTLSLLPPVVTVSPASATLLGGQSEQFFASVTTAPATGVTWSVSPAGIGTVSASGLYSAPITISSAQTVTVTATSQFDPAKSSSATIALSPSKCEATEYSYTRPIVIDHTKVPNSDQANFPFLLNVTDPALASTSNGGHIASSTGLDVVFSTDSGGLNRLDYELEEYNPVTGQMIAWIRIPNVSHASDTVVYMFYGNPSIGASQQNPNGVWNGGFSAVYHMQTQDAGVNVTDSTSNGNSGIAGNNGMELPVVAPGVFGTGSGSFNGSEGIYLPPFSLSTFTVSAWVSSASSSPTGAFFAGVPGAIEARMRSDGTLDYLQEDTVDIGVSLTPIVNNQWNHVAISDDGVTATLYINGMPSGSYASGQAFASSNYMIGAAGNRENFIGNIDEVHLSQSPRSADWIAAEYNNQSSPSTFSTFYPEETQAVVPASVTLYATQFQQFVIPGVCSSAPVIWSKSSGAAGAMSTSGLYTAPDTIETQQQLTITATTLGDASAAYSATVTLMPPVAISMTPASGTLYGGQTEQFAANVSNTSNSAVAWSISPTGIGTISSSGLYAAPASIASIQTIYLTATSHADSSKHATATVTLIPPGPGIPVSVSVTPLSSTLYIGQTEQLTANVANTNNPGVTWSISPSGTGTVSAEGVYSAPTTLSSFQIVTVTATSVADTTKSASATITVTTTPCGSSGYSYVRTVVIDHTKVPNSDQANFPFLFNTTDPLLASATNGGHVTSANGFDIYFSTDPGGSTKLDHQIESYNAATGQFAAWIRIPALSHSTDTVIYMFYGNPNVTSSLENVSGVWDSNFNAVYHLQNTPTGTSVLDSTTNANSGIVGNNGITLPTPATGIFGAGAGSFNGSQGVYLPPFSVSTFTTSAWIFPTVSGQTGAFFAGAPGAMEARMRSDNTVDLLEEDVVDMGASSSQLTVNAWNHVAVSYDGSTARFYINGVPSGTSSVLATFGSGNYFIGEAGNGENFVGSIDELHQSGTVRTADWIAAEYNNQSSPASFYSISSENGFIVSPSIVGLYALQSQQLRATGVCNAAATWTMPSGSPGTLTANGIYTAPASITTQQIVTVTATSQANSSITATATITLFPPVTVSVTPASSTLTPDQNQQFAASVGNSSNQAVIWTINSGGVGSIDANGVYSAPSSITAQQTVTITATSQTDPTKSASAMITLSPSQCASSGYGYQRVLIIDHTKVPNEDLSNFPLLFDSTDPAFASTANGGKVESSHGNDIIFSTDPNGLTKLDHELEEYNPATGQVIAWIRIPTLSHSTDTVLYVFYGNPNIAGSQQNPGGVWDSNYQAVYHLASIGAGAATDSTANSNAGTLTSVSAATGQIDGAISLDGSSSYLQIPGADFPNYPRGTYFNPVPSGVDGNPTLSATFGLWFKTATPGGILSQFPTQYCSADIFGFCITESPMTPGAPDNTFLGWNTMLYVDDNGNLIGGGVVTGSNNSGRTYNDNQWHYAALTYAPDGTNTLYVDGQNLGSAPNLNPTGYSQAYTYFVGAGYTRLAELGNWSWLYFNGQMDNITVSNLARSGDWIQTEYNNQGSPSTFYTLYPTSVPQVVPSTATLYGSQSQQFAATGACNANVSWSMSSGALGTLSASGVFDAPEAVTSQQTLTVTATSQTNGVTIGTAVVTLLPPPAPITLAASSPSPYTVGTSHTFTVILRDEFGSAEPGVVVNISVVGANNNYGTAITDQSGVATYNYVGSNAGNDSIQATAIVNGQTLTSSSLSVSWVTPAPVAPQAAATLGIPPTLGWGGLVGAFTDSTGAVIEPLAIGANAQPFIVPSGATQLQLGVDDNYYEDNGGSGFVVSVNSTTVNVPPTAMPWTWATGGLNNGYQFGLNDGTNPIVAATGLTQGQVVQVAYQSGTVSTSFPASPLVNANGNQATLTGVTQTNGSNYPTLYTTPSSYPMGQPLPLTTFVTNSSGTPAPSIPVTLNVSGANPGQYEGTTNASGTAAFAYIGTNGGSDSLRVQASPSGQSTLESNQAAVTWTSYPNPPTSATLALSLYTNLGNGQFFAILLTDASGNPIENANVGFYVTGADTVTQSSITDVTGHVSFSFTHTQNGNFSIVAVTTVNRNVIISNVINGNWTMQPTTVTGGTVDTISVGISAPNTVTMPNTLTLTGTVADNVGITPTVVWSQVSGPGTVTFANPLQAITTATFSESGNYVLELTGTDTGVTGSAQFAVTVRPNEPTVALNGWIGSPVYGSSVSGIVPITLAPGITLQTGTLVYAPANNLSNTTVLNANTTGSGQIGTLDTTTLANGTYWILLQSTQTNGQSEYDEVKISVVGNYKPGRLTTTVTDIVVPAPGVAINIQRNYDSLNTGTIGDFGYGWNLGTTVNLAVDQTNDVTFTLGGQRRTFYFEPQPPPCAGLLCTFEFIYASFTPEPGFFGSLTTSGPGCSSLIDIMVLDGGTWQCAGGGLYNPPGYIYTDPSGTQYNINANGSLQSVVDRVGNALTITPAGITSSTGLSVPFVRDSQGRITRITDTLGNQYLYAYDTNGNLATVTYPNITQPTTYTYAANHYYTGGTDVRNNPLPVTAYYGPTDTDPNGLSLNGRVQSGTDALGQTRTYTYDLLAHSMTVTFPPDGGGNVGSETSVDDNYGMMLSYTNPIGLTTSYTYDANHNRTSETDPLGHTTTYTYDSNGNTASITYPVTATSTNTTSYTTFNQYSQPISTTDELGNVRVYNYDANFNPQSVTDSIGTVASYYFNASGQPLAAAVGYDITQQPSRASLYTYDGNGNLASNVDPLGRTTSYAYNALGQKLSATVPIPGSNVGGPASTTTFQYDPFGNLLQTSAPLGDVTSSQYDANNNRISSTDARGNVTTYQYDVLNRLTSTTYPTQPSTTTSQTYDFRNNIVNSTDQNGNVTHNTYDLAGKLLSVTRGYGTSNASTTTYTYYADGRKESDTDPLGHTTTYAYDQAGRLITLSNAIGSTHYTYDDAGNQIAVKDPNGNITQSQYDARKRITKTIFPDTTTTTSTYDGPGNVISTTDQAGNIVQNTYNAANQLISTAYLNSPNAPNNTVGFAYNSDGNQTAMTDENGHTTQSVFNVLSRPTSTTLPDGSLTESRQYDVTGNPVSLTHFNGKTTTYTYDSLNRLTVKTPDPSLSEPTVSLTYTPTGQRATMADGSGTTTYTYDSLDRLTAKDTPEGTLSYTYDAAGNVDSVASSHSNGVSLSYTYDDVGRLSTVVDNRLSSGANTTTYTYDPASNLVTATYPNGLQSTFTYDRLNRLTALSTPVSSYAYQLGPTGNRTSATEGTGRTLTWSYDGVYRLTNETIGSDPANKNGTVGYTLDPVGNRKVETSTLGSLNPGSFNYNADDEATTDGYDLNGNTVSTGGKTFAYDSEDRMTSMNGGAVTMLYDGGGNWVAKTVSGVTTRYLIDDLNPTGYPQVVEELSANGTVERRYTYGVQLISESQIESGAWTPSFYETDGGGSVRQLTDAAGAVTDTYEYDAFGNEISSTGTTPNSHLYRAEQYDSDLGLYYLRARYYNPATGRFLSRDPNDGVPTDPASLHKYMYAGGDPVNAWDPSGRATIPFPAPAPPATSSGRSASEYAGIILNISIRAIPAVAAVGCAANIAYTVDALRTPGGSTAAIKVDLPHCSANKDCEPYEEAIQTALAEVIGRYNELLADIHGLYGLYCKNPNSTTKWGSWTGHLFAYEQAQLDLQNAIAEARDAGCPIPPEALEWESKPPPSCPE